jgi:hypothetical protein
MLTLVCAGIWVLVGTAQPPDTPFPRFEEYKTTDIFRGKPVPPKIVRASDRLFRTKIRDGIEAGPNFAGHLTIVEWGCGSSCVSIAIVDAKTGSVNDGPFNILGYGAILDYADGKDEPLSYKHDSRLLVVRGCPEDRNCAEYFYEWSGAGLQLIQKRPAQPAH